MNLVRKSLSILVALPLVSTSALADFKYTDTSQITGGALMGMASFAAKFSKDSRAAMQPITTTHYIKGNKLRTDGSDGSIQIIDLDGRRVISIDNANKTYSVATFDQIKAAMEKARADAEAKAKENPGNKKDAQQAQQLQVTPKITVLPGSGTRVIQGQQTNETKNEDGYGDAGAEQERTTRADTARAAQQHHVHDDDGYVCGAERVGISGGRRILPEDGEGN